MYQYQELTPLHL